ncbi:MAG: hypothetical protein ABEJ98_03555 [Candidatus Nanohaloarchaea archaeon]
MGREELDTVFCNSIRRIAGTRENPERGISVPPWVVEETDFEHGETVRIKLEKIK